MLVFLARDAEQRVLRYANAGVTKSEQAGEVLQFVRFWMKHTGRPPDELVIDSQLTTYQKISKMNRVVICFITIRHRSHTILCQLTRQPQSPFMPILITAFSPISP